MTEKIFGSLFLGLIRKGTIGLADYLSAAAIVLFVLTLFYTQYIMECILTAVYYGVEEKAFYNWNCELKCA